MKNPCDECIIKMCCRTLCEEKNIHSAHITNQLLPLEKKIYSVKEYLRKYLKPSLTKEYNFRLKKYNEELDEISRIHIRKRSSRYE